MTTTAQDYQDILDIEKALLSWFSSQEPDPKHAIVAMARISGALVGRMAKDNELDLKQGTNLLCRILRDHAKRAYTCEIEE